MVKFGNMQSRDYWDEPNSLKQYLADQLYRGQLSFCLGAGVSVGVGLPNWTDLMQQLVDLTPGKSVPPSDLSAEHKAEWILNHIYDNDDIRFSKAVRTALYAGYSIDFEKLSKISLLQAIGAMAMTSARGSASTVITFNFDDLLENYLSFLGMDVSQVDQMPSWYGNSDIEVLHPHGLLKAAEDYVTAEGIVFAQSSYDRIVGQSKNIWRNELTSIFRKRTCIFIGLSGEDSNLMSILTDVSNEHASKKVSFRQPCLIQKKFKKIRLKLGNLEET